MANAAKPTLLPRLFIPALLSMHSVIDWGHHLSALSPTRTYKNIHHRSQSKNRRKVRQRR